MPYIDLKTTCNLDNAKKESLKTQFGKAIESFPGKTENWLMVNIEDEKDMWFGGENSTGCCMADIAIFGKATGEAYNKMTSAMTVILSAELNIPPNRIYIKYSEYDRWGWNGGNF